MSNYADKPLRRVTINLYEEDVDYFESIHGRGWSSTLRKIMHDHTVRSKLTNLTTWENQSAK